MSGLKHCTTVHLADRSFPISQETYISSLPCLDYNCGSHRVVMSFRSDLYRKSETLRLYNCAPHRRMFPLDCTTVHLTDRRFPVETGCPHAPVAVRTAMRLPLVTQPTPHALVMLCRVCPRPFRVRIPVE